MKNKNIREYAIKVLNGMALGLFSSLIIGLILKQVGIFTGLELLERLGQLAQYTMAPAIGAGVAYSVGASPLGIFAGVVAGSIGGGGISINPEGVASISIGEPVGALLSSLVGVEISKLVSGKTKLDIILVPAVTIVTGGIAGYYLAPIISSFMKAVGEVINFATMQQPVVMGILVSVIMGFILTMPISSAAIGISLGLSGLASGAAIIGCSCQMIGFAVISFRENGFGGFIAQGLGTSMIQISNIVKNPKTLIPPIVASAILGPVGTTVFKMEGDSIGSGMGTSGLVGQFSTLSVMGPESIYKIALLHFILPGIISYAVYKVLKKKNWIKDGDLKLYSLQKE
ncbi:hypothetical protein EUAN_21010 [Andreesenia angusta]|uniref:Phosphotransferase system EIIC domain-containing protein n=1 Tax=Andreesenia angusta TaxID=39480 RepID=A0A1S1V764_9FIRM|nr:PTS sugar transporter subunit IIC [Andreesenia angusta]OHW61559.1 hypothetical protein EUAN_21010 [Andreesenia angusta]